MAQTWSRSTSVSHAAASARRVLRVVGGWRCALVADALGAAAPFEQRWSLESPSSSWSQLARSSAAVKVARHGADVVAVNVSLARGGVGPPRAARRRRLALRSRRGCARRGRAVRATVVARVAVVVVVAARAVERGCAGGAAWRRLDRVDVSLARGGVGPPRAARRRRLALRSRRGCARRGRAIRATVVARVAVVVVVAARAVECGCQGGAAMAQAWSRSTSVSQKTPAARRVLRVVGGWRCALVADALGAAAPFEQRLSLESPSSSWSQLARSSAAVKVARPSRRRGRGRR